MAINNKKRKKIRNTHGRNQNMARYIEKHSQCEKHTVGPGIWRKKVKNEENEKQTIQDCNLARKLKSVETEIHTL